MIQFLRIKFFDQLYKISDSPKGEEITGILTHLTDTSQNQQFHDKFFSEIDSAIVMHNVSTQFADGGEFGMGAEIGIGTGKLHARGPIGAKELTSFKFIIEGKGILRK